jgi:hypothetical protein
VISLLIRNMAGIAKMHEFLKAKWVSEPSRNLAALEGIQNMSSLLAHWQPNMDVFFKHRLQYANEHKGGFPYNQLVGNPKKFFSSGGKVAMEAFVFKPIETNAFGKVFAELEKIKRK